MANAATKTETSKPQAANDETIPHVDPKRVMVNKAGQVFRDVMVRMPQGAVSDDLRNPKIWRAVQGNPQSALIQHDHLYVLGFDETWGAECIVWRATNKDASLRVLKVFPFAEGDGAGLYSDGRFEVFFNGADYSVRRVTDKVPMFPNGFSSEGQAIDALRQLYSEG